MITTQAHLASNPLEQPLQSTGAPDSQHTMSLRADLVSPRFRELIPRDFARQHLVISQGPAEAGQGGESPPERLAVSDTTDPVVIFNIGVRLGAPVVPGVADGEAIARLIDEVYGRDSAQAPADSAHETVITRQEGIEALLAHADRDLLSTQGKGPVVKLVDGLLFEALGRSASDIHIQPLADRTLVRLRLDGVLHTVSEIPAARNITSAIISRIKVMGRMDIAERRIPQDGRASVTIADRSIDLRISTLPTSHGERVVIRLLDNTQHLCEFQKLGMPPDVAQKYLDRSSRANGMILLTGPTGSGKTTTLYATLRKVGTPGVNIMTIEDPIEYELSAPPGPGPAPAPGMGSARGDGAAISQSQVNTRKGITFATGLRHILRQDPDVVMVGEIRDEETARIAIQSSLTGHLVFSTLHTNDAASAITRLIDLGIESYLVSASLSAVLAQRLVRKLHPPCGGNGCDECLKTGFRGRTGLFELICVDEAIRELISSGAQLAQIRQAAHSAGTRTLREDGEHLAQAGITTMAEVHRVVHGAF